MVKSEEKIESRKEYTAPQMEVLAFGTQGDLLLLDNSCTGDDCEGDVTF